MTMDNCAKVQLEDPDDWLRMQIALGNDAERKLQEINNWVTNELNLIKQLPFYHSSASNSDKRVDR